jgi:hypothetical protein
VKKLKRKGAKRRGATGLLAAFSRCPWPVTPPERHLLLTKPYSPAWHRAALRETEKVVRKGHPEFSDWKIAKRRIRRKAALGA